MLGFKNGILKSSLILKQIFEVKVCGVCVYFFPFTFYNRRNTGWPCKGFFSWDQASNWQWQEWRPGPCMLNLDYLSVYCKEREVNQLSSLQVEFWGPLMLRDNPLRMKDGEEAWRVQPQVPPVPWTLWHQVICQIYCDSVYNFNWGN